MRPRALVLRLCLTTLACLTALCGLSHAQTLPVLHLEREIPLPGVQGRIDHLSVDLVGQRVFLSALGNGTVEEIDLAQGRRAAEIKGLEEPQGILYLPSNSVLYVASGGDGTVRSYDGRTLQPLKSVSLGDDADNLRFNPVRNTVLVGYGSGAIAELGLDLSRRGEVRLPAHPESFQVAADGGRLFVNLPRNLSLAQVDLEKGTANAGWAHPGELANFPMAWDEQHARLYIACRTPARLITIDAATGKVLQRIPTVGDADDLFYDPARHLLYVIGGEGYIDVVRADAGGQLASVAHVPTAPGARTGLFVPQRNELLVAAPRRGEQPARVLIYSANGSGKGGGN